VKYPVSICEAAGRGAIMAPASATTSWACPDLVDT
jgi:hypothetical protein